jgi:hypothetical protein
MENIVGYRAVWIMERTRIVDGVRVIVINGTGKDLVKSSAGGWIRMLPYTREPPPTPAPARNVQSLAGKLPATGCTSMGVPS